MTRDTLTIRPGIAIVTAVGLLLAGAAVTYLTLQTAFEDRAAVANMPAMRGASPGTSTRDRDTEPGGASMGHAARVGSGRSDVVVPLSTEAAERAGLVLSPVSTGSRITANRVPGVIEPNAYRHVSVTPLAAGRVTRVSVALGERVRRGQTIALIESPELADAERRFVAARAELEAHERELQRTQKLVAIGAASRQELERIHAEHTGKTAEVASARARLDLLGAPVQIATSPDPATNIGRSLSVVAPMDGVVTERQVNVGLNVDAATRLFTIVDLSTVWVVADLHERDFSRVRIGSEATITTTAYPDLIVKAPVSYIDPRINADTRTAKVRVEVPNPRGDLRFGMYVDVQLSGSETTSVVLVPRRAVQSVGNRQIVYRVDPREPGRFVEREVQLGEVVGQQIEVVSGLTSGDVIVAEGSFFVRAEAERLGLRQAGGDTPAPGARKDAASTGGADAADAAIQTADVVVSEQGFEPATVMFRAGVPARLFFTRTTDKTCGTEVAFPSLKITRDLPLNERVEIRLTPTSNETAFLCGMNMLRGSVVVR